MKNALDIRYVKLHFTLVFNEDCEMPKNKVSALRGGMGEMLLRMNCIRDRNCDKCDFRSECIVQRTMYSQYEIVPEKLSVAATDSIGYVFECENYETNFYAGQLLKFNLILFGKTIVYFNQYMMAFNALGQIGIGKNKCRFFIAEVTNTKGERILDKNNIYMQNYCIHTLKDYVDYRLSYFKERESNMYIKFKTPVTIKSKGVFLKDFEASALFDSLRRRIFLLDCFEGIDAEDYYSKDMTIPRILNQESRKCEVMRYSSRQDSKMTLRGIKGYIIIDNIYEEELALLIAGELTHIGKNTSFGFGRYKVY